MGCTATSRPMMAAGFGVMLWDVGWGQAWVREGFLDTELKLKVLQCRGARDVVAKVACNAVYVDLLTQWCFQR